MHMTQAQLLAQLQQIKAVTGAQIAYYLIVLAITGTISGVFIGLCGALLIKHVPYQKFFK